MFKFIGGPLSGVALGLHWTETYLLTVTGMMISVILFTFLGKTLKDNFLSRFYKKRLLFTPRNRRLVKIWRKYGMLGVAFLTPIILTPIGGTIVASSFGESKFRIFLYMFLSALAWGVILTLIIDKLGEKVLGFF
ncbi:small multi-drug export protein [Cytophagaceae bacterium DM2B3-1]|uniref:Small multi-drug export protein n=1 Tax=Xanthocytophaga flava TaxID=3048013 RepID=A0AAE3U7I0_9BACT|nr:small multi-drug export protein [Xanthocytophaga flavus]MDJ1470572.1 small multi-drug export protein [Xanthocytophaga flavus]MDJ1481622.1 small multi-drug export protein [Xanthocytophaga flavus]MDJ1491585.1 small multi-drug export protein [Xanthocytophaga flavus]